MLSPSVVPLLGNMKVYGWALLPDGSSVNQELDCHLSSTDGIGGRILGMETQNSPDQLWRCGGGGDLHALKPGWGGQIWCHFRFLSGAWLSLGLAASCLPKSSEQLMYNSQEASHLGVYKAESTLFSQQYWSGAAAQWPSLQKVLEVSPGHLQLKGFHVPKLRKGITAEARSVEPTDILSSFASGRPSTLRSVKLSNK